MWMMLAVASALTAQPQATKTARRWEANDGSDLSYAFKQQAAYRECLAKFAEGLSMVPDQPDEIEANIAQIPCFKEKDAFISAAEAELKRSTIYVSDDDRANEVQKTLNSISDWTEGIIFSLRRQQSVE